MVVPHLTISKDFEDLAEAAAPYPFQDMIGWLVVLNEPWLPRHGDFPGKEDA